jgi:predicted transport protein
MVTDVESHFRNKSLQVAETFEKLKIILLSFPGTKIHPLKNAIVVSAVKNFVGIKPKKKYLDIEFILDYREEGFPVHKVVQVSGARFAHFVRLGSPDDVDNQLINWVKHAYKIASKF